MIAGLYEGLESGACECERTCVDATHNQMAVGVQMGGYMNMNAVWQCWRYTTEAQKVATRLEVKFPGSS